MMDNNERTREENVARLVRAGLPAEARLDPRVKQDTWHRLSAVCRANCSDAFPNFALILLAGVTGLMSLWAVFELMVLKKPLAVLPTELLVVSALNLAAFPPAFVIWVKNKRRQYV